MIGRRGFLRAASAVGLSAAASQLMRPLSVGAVDGEIPKRLVIFATPNGMIRDAWYPTGGETDFVLGEILSPLAAHRDRLLLLGAERQGAGVRDEVGISIHVKKDGETASGGHGWSKVLTGTNPTLVDVDPHASSVGIDQFIARRIQEEAPFASLELGVRVGAGGSSPDSRTVSYAEGGVPVPVENDPRTAFQRIFAAVGTPDPAIERARTRRQSVLDFTRGELGSLRPRLGSVDRAMLDQHESAIRDIERTLNARVMCTEPEGITAVEPNGWDTYTNVTDVARMQVEIAATALSCDLSRVVTLQYGSAGANNRHPFLPGRAGEWHHSLSHEASEPAAHDAKIAIAQWHAQQLATLFDRLAETPERDGSSVLDHTLVLWINELSDGVFHTHQDMPFLLAGGAGGALRTGRFVRYASKPHNDLLVSVCNAMGLDDVTSFGDPEFCTGPLPGLT